MWLVIAATLLLLWLPVVLAFGPVRISADSNAVIMQALGRSELNDSHPILYTLVLRFFLWPAQAVGNLTAGAVLFGLAQMMFFAGTIAFSITWLARKGAPLGYLLLVLAYFTLSPVFAINSITVWKDIPFNAVLLLLCLKVYDIAESQGKLLMTRRGMASFLSLCVATCFLRGNGFYIVVAVMAGIVVVFRRCWRRWLLWFLPLLILVKLIQGPVYTAFGITRLGTVESAAIPLQQVSRAVANGAPLTKEQTATLEQFIPVQVMKDAYISASPDYVKGNPHFNRENFNQKFGEFMGLWAELFKTNKQVYADAWLLQTLGYWKIDFHGWTALVTETDNPSGIRQNDLWNEWLGVNARAFIAEHTEFFTLSLMAYIALFLTAHLVVKRRYAKLLFVLPFLILWFGMMVGAPTYVEFRYMMLYSLGMPCLICGVIITDRVTEQAKPA